MEVIKWLVFLVNFQALFSKVFSSINFETTDILNLASDVFSKIGNFEEASGKFSSRIDS